jgi:hypothetical protein
MPSYKTHTINTTTEYVDFICQKCKPEDALFRGQSVDRPLLPKLARLDLREPILAAEQKMMSEFKRRVIPLLSARRRSKWDWLAIAQHHGMATRLLDWTLNPFAALWFAVNKPPTKEKGKLHDSVVWVLVPKPRDYAPTSARQNPFEIGRTKVFRPKHVAPRLVTQAGWFTVHKFMKTEDRFIPLERNKSYSSKLTKLLIPPNSFWEMRFDLDRFNVNAATLFPDLDGLCTHIQWLNSYLEDER